MLLKDLRFQKLKDKLALFDNGSFFVLAAVLSFAALFFFYYPAFFGMVPDENEYFRQAFITYSGSAFVPDALHAYNFTMQENGFLSHYPLGQAFFLLPFFSFGWKAVFLSGLLVHLLGIFAFYKILKKLAVDVKFTLLYIFFPIFAFFSRTLMADYTSAVLLLCAFYLYLLKKPAMIFLSGLVIGASLFFRLTNGLAFLALFAAMLFWNRKNILHLVSGFALMLFALLFLNNFLYGGFLSTGQGASFQLDALLFPASIAKLALLLLALYPLMLLSLLFYKKELKREILLSAAFFAVFFSLYWGIDLFPFSPNMLITHSRFLIPVMPLLLIAYSSWLQELSQGFVRKIPYLKKPAWALLLVLLFALNAAIFSQHDAYLKSRAEVKELIFSKTSEGALIVGNTNDFSYLSEAFGDRLYIDYRSEGLSTYFSGFDSYVIVSRNLDKLGIRTLEALIQDYKGMLVGKTEGRIVVELYKIPKPELWKNQALDDFIPKDTLEFCDSLADDSSISCFYARAIAQKKPLLCEKVGSIRPNCYFDTAVRMLDASLCEKANYWNNMCFIEIAEKTRNPILCEKAGARKQACYHNLAVLTGNQQLCRLAGRFEKKCNSYWNGIEKPKHFPKYIP